MLAPNDDFVPQLQPQSATNLPPTNLHPVDLMMRDWEFPSAENLPTPPASPLDAALEYIKLGWAVIPCCRALHDGPHACSAQPALDTHKNCEKPGKMPTRVWGGRKSTTPAEARQFWRDGNASTGANIALLLGPARLIAFDIDGPEGEARLTDIEAQLGPLPPTLENTTGRAEGGRHLLFKLHPDVTAAEIAAISKSCAGLHFDGQRLVATNKDSPNPTPGLDLRAGAPDRAGSFILVAPSLHRSGVPYQWSGGPLAELPRAWVDALPRKAVEALKNTKPSAVQKSERSGKALADHPAFQPGTPAPPRAISPSSKAAVAYYESTRDALVREVRGATGARNTTLNRNTLRLWRVGQAARIDRSVVWDVMIAAGRDAGLGDAEVEATVAGAMRKGDEDGPAQIPDREQTRTTGQGGEERGGGKQKTDPRPEMTDPRLEIETGPRRLSLATPTCTSLLRLGSRG